MCIYIYILYIYIIIYIWIILCAKVASQVRKNQLLADFGSVGPDPRSMRKNNQTSLTWGLPASRTSPSVGGLQEGLSGNGDLIPKYLSLGVKSLCALVIHMDHRFWFVCNSVLSTNILWMEEILHHLGWLKPYKWDIYYLSTGAAFRNHPRYFLSYPLVMSKSLLKLWPI